MGSSRIFFVKEKVYTIELPTRREKNKWTAKISRVSTFQINKHVYRLCDSAVTYIQFSSAHVIPFSKIEKAHRLIPLIRWCAAKSRRHDGIPVHLCVTLLCRFVVVCCDGVDVNSLQRELEEKRDLFARFPKRQFSDNVVKVIAFRCILQLRK